jgi:uncharacterized protein
MAIDSAGKVDAHVHLTPLPPPNPSLAPQGGIDRCMEALLADMDSLGIRWALYMAEQFAEPGRSLRESIEVLRKSGGRILLSATVDPTQDAERIDTVLASWDRCEERIRAVKLYPGYQPFGVDDPRLEPVLQWAERKQVPIFLHQGDVGLPTGRLKLAHPLLLDEVAVRWPAVRFVICHLGNPWTEEAAIVARKNANVWADCSGLLYPFSPYEARVRRIAQDKLDHALALLGEPSKLLFGSDWPNCSVTESLGLIQALDIPPAHKELIWRGNAISLLGLPD